MRQRRQSTVVVLPHVAEDAAVTASDDATTNDNNNNNIESLVQDTELVTAIKANTTQASHQHDMNRLMRHAKGHAENPELEEQGGLSVYEDDLRARLCHAVFVGHVNADLDSVAGAIGAATLFGGTAALAEPVEQLNGEITFALKNCGMEPPPFFNDIDNHETCDIVLVDHTEEKQMVPSLRTSPKLTQRVVGVIDHHALAKSFQTVKPIFIDLRPWGSMSTIVGYLFVSHRKFLPKPLAVLLLHAILSDTLNLRSVTTTDADRSMVALLHTYGGLGRFAMTNQTAARTLSTGDIYMDSDIDLLAKRQFQAKTNWVVALGPYEMVRGDQKDFASGPWKFGISVLEVTNTDAVMKVAKDILLELRLLKKEKGLVDNNHKLDLTMELDFAFLFVVNVVQEDSILLISGGRELALAKAAFLDDETINVHGSDVRLQEAFPGIEAPGSTIQPEETAMILPKGYVSRKAQFVPAFFKALQDNDFGYHAKGPRSQAEDLPDDIKAMLASQVQAKVDAGKGTQKPRRSRNSLRASFHTSAMEMLISQEGQNDDKLIEANELVAQERNGNLYDTMGRIVRTYQVQ